METDQEIGQRVRLLRGTRPQQGVALLMAIKLGHSSWRQTTVAKVEAGDRALRASEVADLAQALGASVHQVLGLPEPTDNDVAIQELEQVEVQVHLRIKALGGAGRWDR